MSQRPGFVNFRVYKNKTKNIHMSLIQEINLFGHLIILLLQEVFFYTIYLFFEYETKVCVRESRILYGNILMLLH